MSTANLRMYVMPGTAAALKAAARAKLSEDAAEGWAVIAQEAASGVTGMSPLMYDPQTIQADAFARENHTGEQPISSVTDLQTTLDDRLRFDAFQTLTASEKVQATLNMGGRERLTANRTYYVRTNGNNSNTGLVNNDAGAFATLNGARDAVYSLDLNGFEVTIQLQVSATPYAGTGWDGPIPGAKTPNPVTIQGDGTNVGGVIVTGTGTNAFRARGGARLLVQGLEVRATGTAQSCMRAAEGGQITYDNIRFGASAGPHKEATDHGRIYFLAGGVGYFITGDAQSHEHITNHGYILNLSGSCIFIGGSKTFSAYYIGAALCGCAQYVDFTITGTAVGQRYFVHKNSVVDAVTLGSTFFPGSVAGATATGGQYIP